MPLIEGPEVFAVPRYHGSSYIYETYGCRCYPCTTAFKSARSDWSARRRAKYRAQKEAATPPMR